MKKLERIKTGTEHGGKKMNDILVKWLEEEKENKHFIKEYATGKALFKMQEYKKREEIYQRKYKADFIDFEKSVLSAKSEDQNSWDDYIEWNAFHSARELWESRYNELINV
jgi:hypothetical protein